MKRTSYAMFSVGTLLANPTFETEERTEEDDENLAIVDESFVKTHEKIAETLVI